jgi:hypothetical protein
VEKLIDRLSLQDVLGLLAPGLLLLLALRGWLGVEPTALMGSALAENDAVVTASLLLLAYGIGMLLLEWVNLGTQIFVHLHLTRDAHRNSPSAVTFSFSQWISLLVVVVLHGMPLPRIGVSFVEAQMMMSEFNQSATHVSGLSPISSPWDRLDLFRKLVQRLGAAADSSVIEAAGQVHSRLLYALCMSLALTMVAIGAIADGIHAMVKTGHISQWLPLAIAAALASYCFRYSAARCWETEIALLCSLAQRRDLA